MAPIIMNYEKSNIFLIRSVTTGEVFISSTCQTLQNRVKTMRRQYRKYMKGETKFYSRYFDIVKTSGHKYELLEPVKCSNKFELREVEKYWMAVLITNGENVINDNKPNEYLIKNYNINVKQGDADDDQDPKAKNMEDLVNRGHYDSRFFGKAQASARV